MRQFLRKPKITFQRIKTWKESNDPQREAKLARIEHVMHHFSQRVFAFDESGSLTIRPQAGTGWQSKTVATPIRCSSERGTPFTN